MGNGFFITIEGIEGSGKTTQVKLLYERLTGSGYDVTCTKEPGSTEIGQKIREILLDPGNNRMEARAEILLYAADRAQDVTEIIEPALNKGKIVLSDRYIDSNIAYQGFGRRLDLDMVRKVNEWVIRGYWPDLTIILDIEPEKGIARARSLSPDKCGDRLEQELIDFHHRVREAYRDMVEGDQAGERFVFLDADLPSDDLHQKLFEIVKERLPE